MLSTCRIMGFPSSVPHQNSPVYPVCTSLTNSVPGRHTNRKSVHGWFMVGFSRFWEPFIRLETLIFFYESDHRSLKNRLNHLPKLQTNHKLIEKYLYKQQKMSYHDLHLATPRNPVQTDLNLIRFLIEVPRWGGGNLQPLVVICVCGFGLVGLGVP